MSFQAVFNRILFFTSALIISHVSTAQSIGGCDNYTPTEGLTVTCSASVTPAATSGVQTATTTSNNNITVNVLSGTTLSINGAPIGIGSGSTVNNSGTLNSRSFFNGYGMSSGANSRSQAGGSTLNNFSSGQIITGGGGSDGMYISASNATSRSNTILNAGSVQTSGANAIGLHINSGATSSAIQNTITNSGSIATTGLLSFGIRLQSAQAMGSIINSGTITTAGLNADGISVRNTGNIISINNSGTITAQGSARGIAVSGAAAIVNSGAISTPSEAIYFDNSASTALSNSLTLLPGSQINGKISFNTNNTTELLSFDGLRNSNFNNELTGANSLQALNGADVKMNTPNGYAYGWGKVKVDENSRLEISSPISNSTGMAASSSSLTKTGEGVLVLSGDNTYTGGTTVSAGTLIISGSVASGVAISQASTLQGNGTIFGNVNNSGMIQPGTSGAQTNITIAGNYTSNGGVFVTELNTVQSNLVANTLTITGQGNIASGSTQIGLINIEKLGQPTSGDGIPLIIATAGAGTDNTAFYYPNRIAAGAYEYSVVKGGTSSPDSWYLKSDNSTSLATAEAYGSQPLENYDPTQQSTQAVTQVIVPGVGPLPSNVTPEPSQRIEVAAYPALPSLANLYARTTVDNFDLRRPDFAQGAQSLGLKTSPMTWGRFLGKSAELRSNDANQGPGLDARTFAIQLGRDVYRKQSDDGAQTFFGPFITFGQAYGNTYSSNGSFKTGNTLLQGFSVGLNATHMTAQGLYVDAVLQGTRFTGVRVNSVLGASMNTTGWGLTASVETGWRIGLTERVSLTPQAQFIYNNSQFSDTADAYAQIGIPNDASSTGRIGVKLAYDASTTQGPRSQAWLRLSGLSTLSGRNPQVSFSNPSGRDRVSFNAQTPANWLSLDAGLNVHISKDAQLSFNLGYDTSITGAYNGVFGQLGLQVAF
jgi:outer membrane autotransporter protein